MFVPNLKRIALFVQKLLGGPKISKFGHVTQGTPTLGSFHDPEAVGVRGVCLEIWSRDLDHAHFGVVLWSGRSRGPSSMFFLPNLKHIALFVQKLLGGPKISKLGHETLSHAPFEP